MNTPPDALRVCTRCGIAKPAEAFSANQGYCKPCHVAAVMASQQRYPERHRAQKRVSYALRTGALVRPDRCERCQTPTKLHAHHEDYAKPLEVSWLCQACHVGRHVEIRSADRPAPIVTVPTAAQAAARALGRLGGLARSERKTAACRENAKKASLANRRV